VRMSAFSDHDQLSFSQLSSAKPQQGSRNNAPARRSSTVGVQPRRSSITGPRRSSIAHKASAQVASSKRRPSRVSGRPVHRTGTDLAGQPAQTQVFDENGTDVTPKPMLTLKPTGTGKGAQQATPGHSTPTSELSDTHAERVSSTGFSRSAYSREGSAGSTSPGATGEEGLSTPGEQHESGDEANNHKRIAYKQEQTPNWEPRLTEIDVENNIQISLSETNTYWLLNIPGRCVQMDSAEATAVEEANELFRSKRKAREGSENYVSASMQTLNLLTKQKDTQALSKLLDDHGCQTSLWEISVSENNDRPDGDRSIRESAIAFGLTSKEMQGKSSIVVGSAKDSIKHDDVSQENHGPSQLTLDQLSGIMVGLALMEKAVIQNSHHDKLLLYRDFKPRENAHSVLHQTDEHALLHLWDFKCDLTSGRNVACMAWNRLNRDLLAVGYGEFDFMEQRCGLVAFWSLMNPKFPEFTFQTPFGVTAMDFSSANPNLLAVGLYDGTVSVYDVRLPCTKPVLESGYTGGKHSDPVWKLRWVQRGSDHGENLVSISTDGRVTQWSIKKGLEQMDLMMLKRVANPRGGGGTKSEAFISRRSSGMCFDFCPRDNGMYVAGTEDGNIHKCSCSYSEQYLESYFGHSGPVYAIQWSPFVPNLFISASADWTIKLWKEDHDTPTALLTFQSGNEEVSDVSWSPTNSTVFGDVTKDGKLEIWDLTTSTLKPLLSTTIQDRMSCLVFSEASPVIVCGGASGSVYVYRLVGVERPEDTTESQAAVLEEAMSSNIISPTS